MTTTLERFATVAADFERRIDSCPPDRWDSPSPCPPWTAREIVAHVIDGFDLVLASAGRPRGADRPEDLVDDWAQAKDAVVDAMSDPETAGRTVPSPMGDFAFKQVVGGVILHDLLAHTWDLARATGQDETLDGDAVRSALAKMTPFDDLLRGPGMFGPKVTPPPDADAQAQLLCFLGRQP